MTWRSPDDVAKELGISGSTVRAKIRCGDWEATRISDRIYRFDEHQFNAIISKTTRRSGRSNNQRLRDALKGMRSTA